MLSDYQRIVEKPHIARLEAEIATLKQRLESAEGLLADARLQLDYLHDKFVKTGTTAALLTRLDIFLQQQEKQNG